MNDSMPELSFNLVGSIPSVKACCGNACAYWKLSRIFFGLRDDPGLFGFSYCCSNFCSSLMSKSIDESLIV